jgi:hypothetical protein
MTDPAGILARLAIRQMYGTVLGLLAPGGCSKPVPIDPACPVSFGAGCSAEPQPPQCYADGGNCCAPLVCQPIGNCDTDSVETACACLVQTCAYKSGTCSYDAGTFSVFCMTD